MPFDRSKFIGQFKAETGERLNNLNLGLVRLEKSPGDISLLEKLMREAHTVKGSATMMGYKRVAEIAHKVEDGFEKAMKGKIKISRLHIDAVFKSLDAMAALLEDKVTWEAKGIDRKFTDNLCREIGDAFSRSGNRADEAARAGDEKNREEKLKSGRKPRPREQEISGAGESIRVDTGKLDKLMNLSGELLISKIRLKEVVNSVSSKLQTPGAPEEAASGILKDLLAVNENMDFLTSSMQAEVMKVRMMPVSVLFDSSPRAMRDLALGKGKDIDFEMYGTDTQLDKGIINEIRDPLMHLLRNAVDHGIEPGKERLAKGKPETGRVILSASREGSQVVIAVSDDGRGVNIDRVRRTAVKMGLTSSRKIGGMPDEQVLQFIFAPAFTTSEEVSDVSGRGVGLDVVRENVARLKGMVEVKSGPEAGTTFVMRLPLTLAITESLLVSAGGDTFAIPIDSVVETVRITRDDIRTVETKDVISLRGHIMPLLRLQDMFALPKRGIFEKSFLPAVIVQSVERKIGILVDELLGRQEIIVKPIGDPLKNIPNIAGATILGSGRVILVLDIPSMIEASREAVFKRPVPPSAPAGEKPRKKKNILLAEDVMSTAMLEKNILESVGYSVIIARDGKDALLRASQEKFDLVITDILMPRMDGFELTERLKKDRIYKDVPVIIVTTRESDSDKRRGLEAGAEAYILKSEFTSEGLLDTIERLIG